MDAAHAVEFQQTFFLLVRQQYAPRLFPVDEILAGRHSDESPDALTGARGLSETVLLNGRRLYCGHVTLLRGIVKYVDDVLRSVRYDFAVTVGPSRQRWILLVAAPAETIRRKGNP